MGRPRRRGLRLRDFDYSTAGLYFVTVCTDERLCMLGRIEAETMVLSKFGDIVARQIRTLHERLAGITIDTFVVMPNHVHLVVVLEAQGGAGRRARQASPLLGTVVGAFKSGSAREINTLRATPTTPVWQRGYHDRIVRDEYELAGVREYIATNPVRWALDPENPHIRLGRQPIGRSSGEASLAPTSRRPAQ